MLILVLIGTIQVSRVLKDLLRRGNYSPIYIARRIGRKLRKLLRMEKVDTTIEFWRCNDDKLHCYDICDRNVVIETSDGKHDHGSSKVKLKNIVDYKWEQRLYPGRLITCHNEGQFIAYAITVNQRASPEGMVRIVNLSLGQRALIKGMSGQVLDLQFAHTSRNVLLGIIEKDALHVYIIEVLQEKIVCGMLLKLNDPINHLPLADRISWCPYIQGNGYEDKYASQLLVWCRSNKFHCYSISSIIKKYGTGEFNGNDISEGSFRFNDPTLWITWALFSADGTTLAFSCHDGTIRFFQVYQHTDDMPRCLHKWKPHDGKPVSSFFFLDNYTQQTADQTLWQHAITCADHNTEIKVWSCETWECTQTIRFKHSLNAYDLCFRAEIDRTSSYLILSDIKSRHLYVLQIRKETIQTGNGTTPTITNGKTSDNYFSSQFDSENTKDNGSTTISSVASSTQANNATTVSRAFISSVAEFPLSSSILCFNILDVAVRRCKTNDIYLMEDLDDYDEDNGAVYCVVIRMFLVQPKSVQSCHLYYQPNVTLNSDVLSTLSSLSSDYKNISQSSDGSGAKEERTNLVALLDANKKSSAERDSSEVISESKAKLAERPVPALNETDELKKIVPINIADSSVISAARSGSVTSLLNASGSSTGAQTKPPIKLMTPDSFTKGADKNDKSKKDDTVNPDVLNTLFMLANVTKQQQQKQQQQQLQGAGTSPNDSLKDKPSPMSMLNIVNSTMIEEQEQAKVRKSVEQKALFETPPVPPMPSAEMLTSGGSSPSREVQEILSLKDNDCLNEYYDSDNILLDETDGIDGDNDELNDLENDIIDDEEDDGYNFKKIDDDDDDEIGQRRSSPPPKQPTQASSEEPEIKPINEEPSSEQEDVDKNKSKGSIDWPKVPEVPHPPQNNFGPSTAQSAPQPVSNPGSSKQLDDISDKMDRLLLIVQAQNCQIKDLRSQLFMLSKQQSDEEQRYRDFTALIEETIRKTLADANHALLTNRLDAIITFHNRKLQESLQKVLPQILFTHTVERMKPMVTSEVNSQTQNHVFQMVSNKVDEISLAIQKEVRAKCLSMDTTLVAGMEKCFKSQPMTDLLTTAIHVGVRKGLEKMYQDSLRTIVLPGFEKSSQELFRQLNMTFSTGTKEYVTKLDQYLGQNKQAADRTSELIDIVKKVPGEVSANVNSKSKADTTVLRDDINREFKQLQRDLLKVIRENIRQEIEKGLEAQASSLEESVLSAVRSQAQTPAPSSVDTQEQIRIALENGQITSAFNQALVSNDLNLLKFTLEKADYKQVFNPCLFDQTILLSLIQQISADMSNHNELKHRYLSDAIVNLDLKESITKQYAPAMMRELMQNCQAFLSANPGNSLGTSVRMLMIAIQGLGFK